MYVFTVHIHSSRLTTWQKSRLHTSNRQRGHADGLLGHTKPVRSHRQGKYLKGVSASSVLVKVCLLACFVVGPDAFAETLRAAGLVDDSGNWSAGETVLVQAGDIFDR